MKRTELLTELHKLRGPVQVKEEIYGLLESDEAKIDMLRSQLKDARNELCIKCGKYHDKHLGYCDGCRWNEDESWLL